MVSLMEVPFASSPRTATAPLQCKVPYLVRAAAAAVGCSRFGARRRCGGRLFLSRCALPLRRSVVSVLMCAVAWAVSFFRFGARCRGCCLILPCPCALPLWWSAVPVSVQAGAALVLCYRLELLC